MFEAPKPRPKESPEDILDPKVRKAIEGIKAEREAMARGEQKEYWWEREPWTTRFDKKGN